MKNPHTSRVRVALLAFGAIGIAACSDVIAPLAPASSPQLAKSSANHKAGTGPSLSFTQAQFDALKTSWGTYNKALADGTQKAEALRCEPTQRATATKRIGAKGGQITLGGGHSINIPAGALASDVDITMESRPGPFLELRFSPHGLKFAKPIELTFSYARCTVPADKPLSVNYVASGFKILETVPVTDKRAVKKMSALTDHFSGYMMSTGFADANDDQGGHGDW